jgi:hypothetical protein
MDHVAVADGARAATVVAGHAADGSAVGGRHIDREEQAVRPQICIQMVQHDAGTHADPPVFLVQRDHVAQMFAGVDDQCLADGLAALRGSGAARQYRHAFFAGDLDGGPDVFHAARHHHAHRHDLVDRGVRAVAPAAEGVEQYVGLRFPAQTSCQGAIRFVPQ